MKVKFKLERIDYLKPQLVYVSGVGKEGGTHSKKERTKFIFCIDVSEGNNLCKTRTFI